MKFAWHDCPALRQVFTREGVRVPVPFGWVAELHQIHAAAKRLRAALDQKPLMGKPRIRARWERE